MKTNFRISQFSRFLLRSENAIQFKIWKWLKVLNSVPFIKKTLVNQVHIGIWSFWMSFTVLQWMKKNSKISEFSSSLLRSEYAIFVRIWKWLKLLNSVPFIKKTLVNHVYIGMNEDKLQNGTELRSFRHFQLLTKITYLDLSRNLENWLFLKFVFIHCKTVKVSQDDQIPM